MGSSTILRVFENLFPLLYKWWTDGTRSSTSNPYLPQLLIEVGGVDLGLLVALLVVKVQVPADEKGAEKLLHLHSNVERDGDDEVIKDQKCQEVWDELQDLEKNKHTKHNTWKCCNLINLTPGLAEHDLLKMFLGARRQLEKLFFYILS